ncbi:copper homeostasis membrane protein CopD [Dyella sp. 2RAF44]|jgi:putative copper resistance protein D|uniref:copper homeostasis membrane protein CopD n=1 Tax=Dyella sp. 2RAF44 TaxID=3233000 RepID=UPI003F936ABC
MFDSLLVLSRFALYLGLMLAFGLPAFVLQALTRNRSALSVVRQTLRVAGAATIVSLLASSAALWAMAQAMSGSSDAGAVWGVVQTLLTQTAVGMTWNLRVAVLLVSLWFTVASGGDTRSRVAVASVLCAVALATLAWAGHGAMNEGPLAWVHLGVDIAHLFAAGAWVGALVALTLISRAASRHAEQKNVALLSSAATGFARSGALIVAVLITSGIVNYIIIVGPTLSGLIETLYGRLLLVKLALFAAMLTLAAANRFRLAPALERARRDDDAATAVSTLTRSLYLETSLAILILGLVAWIGTLDPGGG